MGCSQISGYSIQGTDVCPLADSNYIKVCGCSREREVNHVFMMPVVDTRPPLFRHTLDQFHVFKQKAGTSLFTLLPAPRDRPRACLFACQMSLRREMSSPLQLSDAGRSRTSAGVVSSGEVTLLPTRAGTVARLSGAAGTKAAALIGDTGFLCDLHYTSSLT